MAHFTPNSYEKVLDCLYQSIGDRTYKVSGWGNVTKGYGLKPSEFSRFSGCSRSMFYKSKKQMLAQGLITPINTDKTKQTRHKPRYAITFLGMIKLFQRKNIGVEDFNNFMKSLAGNMVYDEMNSTVFHSSADYEELDEDSYLGLWYELTELKRPSNVHDALTRMFEKIRPSLLCQVLSDILQGVELRWDDKATHVTLSINVSEYNRVTFWKFILKDGSIDCVSSPAPPEFREMPDDYASEDLPIKEFYFHLCEFVLSGVWYILSKYHYEKLPKYLVQGNTLQDMAQRTGPINYFMDIVNDQVYALADKL